MRRGETLSDPAVYLVRPLVQQGNQKKVLEKTKNSQRFKTRALIHEGLSKL